MTVDLRELHHRMQHKVMGWVCRVANYEDTMPAVRQDMRAWVGRNENRLWMLAVSSLGCVKTLMASAVTDHTGDLLVAQESDWLLAPMGRTRHPDTVAAMQTVIAMLNQDAEMAHDLLTAHLDVGGPPALFGVALVGVGTAAALLDENAHSVETQQFLTWQGPS